MLRSSYMLEQRYSGENPLRTLLLLVRGDWGRLVGAIIFHLIKHSPVWVLPLIVANVIDLLTNWQPSFYPRLWLYVGILVLVNLQNIPMHMAFMHLLSLSARNLEMNLRSAIARRMQYLSIDFYKRASTGTIHNKLSRDVETIQTLLMETFPGVLATGAAIIVALITTSIRAPGFLSIYLVIVPVTVVLVRRLRQPIQERNVAFRRQMESMSARLLEMTTLIPITRAHGEEQHELERVEERLSQVRAAGLRLDRINSLFGSVAFVVFQLCNVAVLTIAALLYITQFISLTLGDVVLLTGYFGSMTSSVLALTNMLPQATKAFDAIRSVGEILECPDIEENEGKAIIPSVEGRVTFENVCFRYADADDEGAVIHDFSLDIRPGETIAIVGPSGAGKSTVVNLVVGFIRPTQGYILLDGRDMNTLDMRTYRRFLSVVPQETVLFDGTVRENVTYGSRHVSDTRLEEALKSANAWEFVEGMPQGWDTVIGERGTRLSGGQKQRLAIARALIRNPRILILDEATSALDSVSEELIQEALARLMANRTTFVVAHRLSTIRNASRIVVMDQGGIAQMGSHDELIAQDGIYRHLQVLQIGG
ncbi:MAG: ABC transporter ATP-binding protein [Anaerolineae bacterium]|nr:ABC transporter ATP-binding protein [Anaerolineae bacterium]